VRPADGAIFQRVEVRSLGYRTDLAILTLEGSQVSDQGDHLVIRTPRNPDYWWGNFLLLRDLKPGSGGAWLARFAAEFPDAQHIALGLDETDAGTVDPGELAGMTVEQNAVMTATSVHAPANPNSEAAFRVLEGDADWRQSLELTAAVHAGEPGGNAGFLAARLAAKRELTEAGHGAWYGAFLGGTLVSQLGLVTGKPGLARYQSVETHPAARRRGLAGTLVWHAGATALTVDANTLVMVADPEDVAISVYRSVGFTVTESQLSFIRQPAR
jgi:ribosomal protein S18 acetylase RimI-like enzyme